jgi:hypothetical protein
MSRTEQWKGTLKKVELNGLTNEEFVKDIVKNMSTSEDYTCFEALNDEYGNYYYDKNGDILYEVIAGEVEDSDYMAEAQRDGEKITFQLRFYNGSCPFNECLEDALNKLD